MAWTIEFEPPASRELKKLDPQDSVRILKFLHERVALLENPRDIGEALQGRRLGAYWKYRVGDYRIIASIEDQIVCIVVVQIGNRRDVYRR
jgi:mRNA interferase RelE/StbE